MVRLAVLIACHNRREKTLACLSSLFAARRPDGLAVHAILVDDGSTDGTEAAVRVRFPFVELIRGDGGLYWNRAMHRAFARAMDGGFDAYLWLNDDTLLYPSAIEVLYQTWRNRAADEGKEAIIVGSTQDPDTKETTYGGVVPLSWLRPFRYSLVHPMSMALGCHTMNGNCVLVPKSVASCLGNLEPRFSHAMGDTDYGLRASRAGFKIWVAAGYVGACSRNSVAGTFRDRSLPTAERWKKMMQTKGLPPASWFLFTRRHGGLLWPLHFIWAYLSVALKR